MSSRKQSGKKLTAKSPSKSERRFTISGAGVISKKSSAYMRSSQGKSQVDAIVSVSKTQRKKSA